jgi:hypothetical protein
MSKGSYRGVVKNGTIVLLEGADELSEGTEVRVIPMGKPCSGAELVEALRALPPVPKDVMEEFERILEEAHPTSSRAKQRREESPPEAS